MLRCWHGCMSVCLFVWLCSHCSCSVLCVCSHCRVRLGGCGLHECVGPHSRQQSEAELARSQLADLRLLGALLLGWMGYAEQAATLVALHSTPAKPAGAAATAAASYHAALAALRSELERQAPRDLFDFLWALLTRADLTAPQAQAMVAPQLQRALTTQWSQCDYLEGEMAKELQNGRLFRLMVKLGFVTDRPESERAALQQGRTPDGRGAEGGGCG